LIYQYDEKTSLITKKLDAIPTDTTIPYAVYNMDLDIDNYDNYIGSMDERHNITWLNPPKQKPYSAVVEKLKAAETENAAMKTESERQAAALSDLITMVIGGATT
jgi:hypothetical protein